MVDNNLFGRNKVECGTAHARAVRRAISALRGDRLEDAARICRDVLAVDATHVGALETLAKVLWRSGDDASLEPLLRRMVRLDPYDRDYRRLLGKTLERTGKYHQALEAYRSAGDEEASETLLDWQDGLVASLLRQDPVFRVHFARDSREACESRGFMYRQVDGDLWFSVTRASGVFARPS